jgi:hypothetical protein
MLLAAAGVVPNDVHGEDDYEEEDNNQELNVF